jgi:nitronate monooxygenase
MWPDRRLIELLDIELPIVQAPMAGAMDWELVTGAAQAGALGSLPCAMLNADQVREQMGKIRTRTSKPINLNFFCHPPPSLSNAREAKWRDRLAPYYRELGIDPSVPIPTSNRTAFDAVMCDVVEEVKPRGRELSFRVAAGDSRRAGLGDRLCDHQLGYDRRRGALARSARGRCRHRAGLRSRRPSRHVPDR